MVATAHAIHHLGLDYAAVDVVMRRLLPPTADAGETLAAIMVMEAEALTILNGGSS